ncbi:MAG: hypothetical protein U1E46_16420 [Hyphomicrobiales bacterium]
MTALLVLLTIADVALAVLLIAVSGFVLEGVNNTGPMMPEAVFFVALVVVCLVAPIAAWALRRKLDPMIVLVIAAAPLAVAAVAFAI